MITNRWPEMTTASQQRRLFFALWPDAATRAALAQTQSGLTGAVIRAEKLHLTMAFLGQRPVGALAALCQVMAALPAQPLMLQLDRYGYFASQRIAWAGMQSVPPALLELRCDLMRLLAAHLLVPAFEEERFVPHVTLARKAEPAAATGFAPIFWHATQMVLAAPSMATHGYQIFAARSLA